MPPGTFRRVIDNVAAWIGRPNSAWRATFRELGLSWALFVFSGARIQCIRILDPTKPSPVLHRPGFARPTKDEIIREIWIRRGGGNF